MQAPYANSDTKSPLRCVVTLDSSRHERGEVERAVRQWVLNAVAGSVLGQDDIYRIWDISNGSLEESGLLTELDNAAYQVVRSNGMLNLNLSEYQGSEAPTKVAAGFIPPAHILAQYAKYRVAPRRERSLLGTSGRSTIQEVEEAAKLSTERSNEGLDLTSYTARKVTREDLELAFSAHAPHALVESLLATQKPTLRHLLNPNFYFLSPMTSEEVREALAEFAPLNPAPIRGAAFPSDAISDANRSDSDGVQGEGTGEARKALIVYTPYASRELIEHFTQKAIREEVRKLGSDRLDDVFDIWEKTAETNFIHSFIFGIDKETYDKASVSGTLVEDFPLSPETVAEGETYPASFIPPAEEIASMAREWAGIKEEGERDRRAWLIRKVGARD